MKLSSLFQAMALATTLALAGPTKAQELVVWHDLGDNGIKWFQTLSAEFAKTRPGVTVKSINYPTDQWFGRSISAINTNTAPDLIFNNYERVIRVADQTNKLVDLKPVLASVSDKAFLLEDDLRVATHANKMIILPIQRVQMGFGVRKSWLDKVGEKFPTTWADVQRVAVKFRDNDPDGDGKANTFGMALEAAKPRDLIHIIDLFMFGSGLRHTLIDPQGKIVVDEPARAKVLEEVLKAFTEYRYVPPDTINREEMGPALCSGRGLPGGPLARIRWPQERRGDRRYARCGCARKLAQPGYCR